MLCPEVWNFDSPKIITYSKQNETLDSVKGIIKMNNFYKSVVVTCPDESHTPNSIEEAILEDNEYYIVKHCPVIELMDSDFIENFIRNGNLYCLSADKNCVIHNCAAVTPDGILTLHLLEFIFQTLGLEGMRRPWDFYEVKIDLKNLKQVNKVKQSLSRLEPFNLYVVWEPHSEDICPSSIAKYFHDKNISISIHSPQIKKLSPPVVEIPSLIDTDLEEMAEWIGMLALQADLSPTECYVSTYSQPESSSPIKSTRISILIVKGFLTPTAISKLPERVLEHVTSREVHNYWVALSVQSIEHSLWQWSPSSQRMFQYHDSSCNIFFKQDGIKMFSMGQLKFT